MDFINISIPKKLFSKKAQISLEFSILIGAVIAAAAILGYYMIDVSQKIQDSSISSMNNTSNVALEGLKNV
ncbi:class III signal peptide-containing protein [Methanococcus voltae]|uniref:Uncharacterized protein (UPF0333 family) n=2 Tax=Methanococcus voltae TaxID=2188 RepID=A0A8J7RE06_METVO|nr:class III signal peptide-containing protein [Methanococcus voltae]MBP2172566.1 uncharacterized protein (UPF0333 family) [Methanococcus voltae]MBP2201527.1 uncharacterized protein (UPF0333 family) [Methanococcus voltae]MCS3922316.1 uncharacterized protein (UPF0333 family) [Methanococcus voltae PS]